MNGGGKAIGPVPTAYAVLMQLANAPHPNAARLFAYFMTTKDAHDAVHLRCIEKLARLVAK